MSGDWQATEDGISELAVRGNATTGTDWSVFKQLCHLLGENEMETRE